MWTLSQFERGLARPSFLLCCPTSHITVGSMACGHSWGQKVAASVQRQPPRHGCARKAKDGGQAVGSALLAVYRSKVYGRWLRKTSVRERNWWGKRGQDTELRLPGLQRCMMNLRRVLGNVRRNDELYCCCFCNLWWVAL
jgi:hypothetical protein